MRKDDADGGFAAGGRAGTGLGTVEGAATAEGCEGAGAAIRSTIEAALDVVLVRTSLDRPAPARASINKSFGKSKPGGIAIVARLSVAAGADSHEVFHSLPYGGPGEQKYGSAAAKQ